MWPRIVAMGVSPMMSLNRSSRPDSKTQQCRPVATSLLYLADGLAGIYCVATLPEDRAKGLGAHTTAEAFRRAHELGYRVGVLQSSPAGHSVHVGLQG